MSIINMSFDQAKQFEDLPEGEYKFRIISVPELRQAQNSDTQWVNIRLEAVDPPAGDVLYNDVYHSLFLPKEGDDEKRANRSLSAIGDFVQAFDIKLPEPSVSGLLNNLEECVGCEGWALLGTRKDRETGDARTVVKRFLSGV